MLLLIISLLTLASIFPMVMYLLLSFLHRWHPPALAISASDVDSTARREKVHAHH